jgi:hypothetical protein
MGGGITFACPECGGLYRFSHDCEEPQKNHEEEE